MPKEITRAYEYLIQVSSEEEARELEAQLEHYNSQYNISDVKLARR